MDSGQLEVQSVARSNFAFSNAFHEQLINNGEGGNLVFSPFSLGLVLLAARFGARRETARQLDRVLNPIDTATKELDELRPMRRGFFRVLKSIAEDKSSDYKVIVANRIFMGVGFNVSSTFKTIAKATLDIKVKQLNFTEDGGRPAAAAMNSWVANKTDGKADSIIFPNSLTSQTQVVLVNTIHVKGPWAIPFEPEETLDAPFYSNSNKQTTVAMMRSEDRYEHGDLRELKATAVVIPYQGGRYSMHVYIPKAKDGLDELLQALKSTSMQRIRENLVKPGNCEKVDLSIPKFKIQTELKLMEPLKKMGARDMFSASGTDFTEISEDEKVYVSDVLQKAFITVDEAGIEAAAGSYVSAGVVCSPSVTKVTADRPFYFQIVDEKMDVVLLAGAVRNPSATVPAPYNVESTTEGMPADFAPKLVFGTAHSGIKAYYTEGTNQVDTMIARTERLNGVAWNPVQQALYFCSPTVIYKALHDGTSVQIVLQADKYKQIQAIAMDWITGNLYGVNHAGVVFACNTEGGNPLKCATVLRDQGRLHGIAVDPAQGTMYFTTHYESIRRGSVLKAGLDGSDRTVIVKRLKCPGGITIDRNSSKLFWTDYFAHLLQSSDLNGENVQTIAKLRDGPEPWGIAAYNDRVFWGNDKARTVQGADKTGGDIQTIYTAPSSVTHLTWVTKDVPQFSHQNDCDGLGCPNICVLTPSSARCMG